MSVSGVQEISPRSFHLTFLLRFWKTSFQISRHGKNSLLWIERRSLSLSLLHRERERRWDEDLLETSLSLSSRLSLFQLAFGIKFWVRLMKLNQEPIFLIFGKSENESQRRVKSKVEIERNGRTPQLWCLRYVVWIVSYSRPLEEVCEERLGWKIWIWKGGRRTIQE